MALIDHGLNYRQKNHIRRLHDAGTGVQAISRIVGVTERLVRNCVGSSTPEQDRFGPLPDSQEWRELSPGARSGLTRKRINAAKAE